MPERFPPIEPVKTRGAFASHPGSANRHLDERIDLVRDSSAALAIAVRGLGHSRPGRLGADRVADLALRVFKERTSSMLDDLAEVWWRAEHGADEGARVRPFSSLPIADRAEMRARVKRLLAERIPDALGDQAVLEAETKRLLELPTNALRRAGDELVRMAERDRSWLGLGAAAEAVIFAAGQASIGHIGDGRVVRMRRGRLEGLTRAHTLHNDYADANGGELPSGDLPADIIVRVLGMPGERAGVATVTVPIEKRDVFLILTAACAAAYDDGELRAALLKYGVEAAPRLVEDAQTRTDRNLGAVAVEIL